MLKPYNQPWTLKLHEQQMSWKNFGLPGGSLHSHCRYDQDGDGPGRNSQRAKPTTIQKNGCRLLTESRIKVKAKHFSTLKLGVFRILAQHSSCYALMIPVSGIFPFLNGSWGFFFFLVVFWCVWVIIKNAVWQQKGMKCGYMWQDAWTSKTLC